METNIKIVDAMCGAGKTSWAIQMINAAEKVPGFGEQPDKKYIYVTPYLDEVKRVVKNTKADFFEPDAQLGKGSKMEHFKMMIALGKNIVTTHEIFKRMDVETIEDIETEGYVLIMDETAQVIEAINSISEEDISYLLKLNSIKIEDELGKVTWLDEEYGKSENSRFRDIKIMADNGTLFIQNNKAFYWTMNVKAFEVFEEVYILTYLFDAQVQKYYYDMQNVEYEKYSVQKVENRYSIVTYDKTLEQREEMYNKLNIYEGKMNHNFDNREEDASAKELKTIKENQLSGGWFDKASKGEITQLNKNLLNYFTNYHNVPMGELFWTTLSNMAPELTNKKYKFNKKGNREKDNFLSFNARATNDYADRTAMAFVYNRFMNPNDKAFFTTRGISVNQDLLAVSDLIQFLFRGCIRKGEPMSCYIPSERMRKLLNDWAEFKI